MCLAVPGKILSIQGDDPAFRTGRVSFGGVVREVNLAYTPDAAIDDHVLVHAGFALNKIDEAEARQLLEFLSRMDELEELGPEAGEPGERSA